MLTSFEYHTQGILHVQVGALGVNATCGVNATGNRSLRTFGSKEQLQKILKIANVDLKWHESGCSELDRVFGKYDEMERLKAYILAGCVLLFWMSFALDAYGSLRASPEYRRRFLTLSRMTNFLGRSEI